MIMTVLKWINLARGIIKQTKVFKTTAISFWFASICIISSNFTNEMILSLIDFPYPCVIIRPFLRTPQNTQSREPHSRVFEQHEGLVAIQKVGV